MKKPEEFIEEEYERVKDIVGEEKAKKYFHNKESFGFYATGALLFYHDIKKFIKSKPILFVIIASVLIGLVILLIKYIYMY